MSKMLVVSDLEGVFMPEMWPIIGQKLGIPELSATTRDTHDFRQLMEKRISALNRENVTFSMIEDALGDVKPFKGAEDAMSRINGLLNTECAIITDSFREFLDVTLKKRFGWKLFANSFEIDHDRIKSCIFDVGSQKGEVLRRIKGPSQNVLAIGDSSNDIEMLKAAGFKVLFNPSTNLRNMFMDSMTCNNFQDLVEIVTRLTNA